MTSARKKPGSNRLAIKLLVSSGCVGLLLGAAATSSAEVRVTPSSTCRPGLVSRTMSMWVQPGYWSATSYAFLADTAFDCPIMTGTNFVPKSIYLDFNLSTMTGIYATAYRSTFDGTTQESRPLINGYVSAGWHDMGGSVTFSSSSPWDYYDVSFSGTNSFLGIGVSN
jgi:hypothetical protein